jgi:hypothetical protein
MIKNIAKGFFIPWKGSPPPKKQFPNYQMKTEDERFVDEEIVRLLQIGAIRKVCNAPRIVSPIDVVPKKDNKKRLIVDLRFVNQFIKLPRFKMENLHTALELIKPMDKFLKVDLKDTSMAGSTGNHKSI